VGAGSLVGHVVESQHDHHERDAQVKGDLGDQIVEASLSFERRSDGRATAHGVALSGCKDQNREYDRNEQA